MTSPLTLDLLYRADLGVLNARWLGEPGPEVVKAEYDAVLAAARAHNAWRWLVDVRRRPLPDPELSAWVVAAWLPQVVAAAPQRPRLAYLISPQRAEFIRADTPQSRTVQTALGAGQGYDMAIFGDEGEAMRWLLA